MFKYAALLPVMIMMVQAKPVVESPAQAAAVSTTSPQISRMQLPAVSSRVEFVILNVGAEKTPVDQPTLAFANETQSADR